MLPCAPGLQQVIDSYQFVREPAPERFVIGSWPHARLLVPNHVEYEFGGPLADGLKMFPVTWLGPNTRPIENRVRSTTLCGFSVSMTAFGGFLLTARPQGAFRNRMVDASQLFGEAATKLLSERLRTIESPQEGGHVLNEWLLEQVASPLPSVPLEVERLLIALQRRTSLSERLFLGEQARELAISERHLRREFVRCVGVTPKDYDLIWRINEAWNRLEEGQSAEEVAHRLGFTDYAHLHRHFRTHTQTSPGAYGESPAHDQLAVFKHRPSD